MQIRYCFGVYHCPPAAKWLPRAVSHQQVSRPTLLLPVDVAWLGGFNKTFRSHREAGVGAGLQDEIEANTTMLRNTLLPLESPSLAHVSILQVPVGLRVTLEP